MMLVATCGMAPTIQAPITVQMLVALMIAVLHIRAMVLLVLGGSG